MEASQVDVSEPFTLTASVRPHPTIYDDHWVLRVQVADKSFEIVPFLWSRLGLRAPVHERSSTRLLAWGPWSALEGAWEELDRLAAELRAIRAHRLPRGHPTVAACLTRMGPTARRWMLCHLRHLPP